MFVRVCAVIAACLFAVVTAFQIALVLGAPWGEFTQGGATSGALATGGRMLALVSALLLVAMAFVVLARAGLGPLHRVSRRVVGVLIWLTVAYCAVGLLANLASRSVNERAVWAPVTAVLVVLILIVALGTRGAGESVETRS